MAATAKVQPLGLRASHTGPIQKLAPYTGIDKETGDFKKKLVLKADGTPMQDANGKPVLEARTSYSIEIYGMGWKKRVDTTPEDYAELIDGDTYEVDLCIQDTDWGSRILLVDADHKPTIGRQPSGGELVRKAS